MEKVLRLSLILGDLEGGKVKDCPPKFVTCDALVKKMVGTLDFWTAYYTGGVVNKRELNFDVKVYLGDCRESHKFVDWWFDNYSTFPFLQVIASEKVLNQKLRIVKDGDK